MNPSSSDIGGSDASARMLAGLAPVPGGERVKYPHVIAALERLARTGAAAGQRLPPHRLLATRLGITIATLTRAIGELTRRGVLVTRTGSGTFVAPQPAAVPAAAPAGGLVDLRLCMPPLGPVQELLGRTLAGLAGVPEVFGYEPLGGDAESRAAGAAWLRLRGLDVPAEAVQVVGGAHEGMLAALKAVTRPGDRVLCEALHYTGLRRLATLLQIELIGVPITAQGLDTEAFARLCRDVAPRAAVLTPVMQNPTTATLGLEERQFVIAAARGADAIVIEDDINGHLSGDTLPPLARLAPDRVILATSLSKSIAPGLRVGYVLAPPPLREAVQTALYTLGWTCGALQGAMAKRLIASGDAQACVMAQRAEALGRMRLAQTYLGPALALGQPAGALRHPLYHAWLTLPPGRRAGEFTAELLTRQVLVAPAYEFMQDDTQPPEAIRLSLGREATSLLVTALERIAAVMGQRAPAPSALV